MTTDPLATAHLGVLRSGIPPRGVDPLLDTLFDAHLGWFAIAIAGAGSPRVDESFCAVLADDEPFAVALVDDASFCAVLVDDQIFCRK